MRPFLSWLLCVVAFQSFAAEKANDLSLAQRYPVEKLREILLPRAQWHPFPTFKDRAGWAGLPEAIKAELLKLGEEALAKPVPAVPATLYLEYRRIGNRSHYEGVFFERRSMLQQLVTAECIEGKGRFLDAAANTLWAICDEATWCVPAHVGAQKAGTGLPDVTEPIVDLFAAETGVSVAWTLYLLGPELDRVSPQIRKRAELELARRILNPVFERDDFGWMALNVSSTSRRPNNWTPWISASVLTSALACEADAERRVQIVQKMLHSIDGFLKFYPTDGSCDEGPGYWGHAGGSLLDCLDLLHRATAGKLDVFGEALVKEIGRFIYRAHICGEYFVPVGDCSAKFEPERDVVFRFGKRINDLNLLALAGYGAKVDMFGGRFFGRFLNDVFDAGAILALKPASAPLVREVWLGSEDMQMLAARGQGGSCQGLYLAAWGGHNAQSHNHNDVGNFLVFADGQPVFVDVGAPTYTAKTFSGQRYDIWAMQSGYHNCPTINGVMQSAGRQFAARAVKCETNEAFAELQMDIAAAYPQSAKVKSWVRTVRLNGGKEIQITEDFELDQASGETSLNFMTPIAPDIKQAGSVLLTVKDATAVRLEYDAAKLVPNVERMELDDGRLARSWSTGMYRVVLRAKVGALKDIWKLRVTTVGP